MSGQRQKNRPEQGVLAFPADSRSEAPKADGKGTETLVAKRRPESLAETERLMEEVCEWENCQQALQRVKANKGSPGVDGMTVEQLPDYLKQHGPEIREQLLTGTYEAKPVRRVEIPKPDGGVRKLGIPSVLGSICPAGGVAGSAEALGPDVLRAQPRFSTGAQRAASGATGAAVHRRRAPRGGGLGFGEIFRPSESRSPDSGGGQARGRPTDAPVDRSLSEGRSAGERIGDGGR